MARTHSSSSRNDDLIWTTSCSRTIGNGQAKIQNVKTNLKAHSQMRLKIGLLSWQQELCCVVWWAGEGEGWNLRVKPTPRRFTKRRRIHYSSRKADSALKYCSSVSHTAPYLPLCSRLGSRVFFCSLNWERCQNIPSPPFRLPSVFTSYIRHKGALDIFYSLQTSSGDFSELCFTD